MRNPVTAMVTGFFHAHFWPSTPSFTPFRFLYPFSCAGDLFDKRLHPGGAVPLHFIRHMAVDVQRKGCGGMSQVALNRFDVISGADGGHGVAVPQM